MNDSRVKKIFLIVLLIAVGIIAYVAYVFFHIVGRIPVSYAAWDTGTLLVTYMETNDDKWPSSWEDLIGLVTAETDNSIRLHCCGSDMNRVEYVRSLRERVSVDWSFEPGRSRSALPVTRADGSALRALWENPNQMVHDYLDERASANKPQPIQQSGEDTGA